MLADNDIIQRRVHEAITRHVFPGCVIGVAHREQKSEILAFGNYTYEPDAAAVTTDTIYDLASITKSIPTASLALQLIEFGILSLDDLVSKHVPEFRNTDAGIVTIRHLLTYTVGGYALSEYKDKSPEELYEIIMTRNFTVHPGAGFVYANVPAFLLGLVVERLKGASLAVAADEHFFKPLGMSHTTFSPRLFPSDMIAPTEIDIWRGGEVRGLVHDESAYVFTVKGNRPAGHAGLFSNVPDLLKFCEILLRGGALPGKRFFSEETLALMETNQIASMGLQTALGWELCQPRFMGRHCTEHRFGKTGFTGTSIVVDRANGKALVILSNRTYPKRPPDQNAINAFRSDIADIVFA